MIRTWILLFLVAIAIPCASAQKPARAKVATASEHKLIDIKVTGSERYTGKDVLPASGLTLNQEVNEADFKEAARRIGESGLFSDVAYTYSYSPEGTKLEFQLKDVEEKNLVPAQFENFVWFTDAELDAELQRRLGLFRGKVPIAGTLAERMAAILQDLMGEKQLPGRVDYLPVTHQDGGDAIAFAFRVESVAIVIQSVAFPGATPEQAALLKNVGRKIEEANYFRSSMAKVAELDFLPIYLQRGFLKASFAPSEARVLSQNAGDVQIEAVFPVQPGKVYSVSSADWTGNTAIPSGDLQKLIHLTQGQPADAVRLQRDLDTVLQAYKSHGYMRAEVKPSTAFDEDKGLVQYRLAVTEGAVYKMGELELVGLDSQATAKMREAWTLQEGDVYNADYPKKFVDLATKMLPGGVRWGISIGEAVNESDTTVDVTIRYTPR